MNPNIVNLNGKPLVIRKTLAMNVNLCYKNREIEVKLLVEGVNSMKIVDKHLQTMFPDPEDLIIGKSKDVYFNPPDDSKADFARVRFFPDREGGQMTIK